MLQCPRDKNFKPFYIDFEQGKANYRRVFPGKELLAKAVGFKHSNPPSVIDTTAGLGRDAFVLASLGCVVSLIERSPILIGLLQDALLRAAKNDALTEIIERMTLFGNDALVILPSLKADVVYLDPMYPTRKKSALVKKDMRILQDIVGSNDDAAGLFELAKKSAMKRIVVKRPRLGEYLAEQRPDFSYSGKHSRFDIYVLK